MRTVPFNLLSCSCGDCLHWEILENGIICKTCEKHFAVPGVKALIQEHVELHPQLSWQVHER